MIRLILRLFTEAIELLGACLVVVLLIAAGYAILT